MSVPIARARARAASPSRDSSARSGAPIGSRGAPSMRLFRTRQVLRIGPESQVRSGLAALSIPLFRTGFALRGGLAGGGLLLLVLHRQPLDLGHQAVRLVRAQPRNAQQVLALQVDDVVKGVVP